MYLVQISCLIILACLLKITINLNGKSKQKPGPISISAHHTGQKVCFKNDMGLVNFSYKNWWYQIWYAKVNSVRCHNFVIRKRQVLTSGMHL